MCKVRSANTNNKRESVVIGSSETCKKSWDALNFRRKILRVGPYQNMLM